MHASSPTTIHVENKARQNGLKNKRLQHIEGNQTHTYGSIEQESGHTVATVLSGKKTKGCKPRQKSDNHQKNIHLLILLPSHQLFSEGESIPELPRRVHHH